MRRSIVVVLCVASLVPFASAAEEQRPREIIGQLWAPAADLATAEEVTRCVYLNGQQPEFDGWVGRIELLAPEDPGRAFRLYDPNMGIGPAPSDFDVAFFDALGDCTMGNEPLARFDGPANEEGTIPEGAQYALVTTSDDILVPYVIEVFPPAAG